MPRAASTLPVRPRWPVPCLLLLAGLAATGGCAQTALFGNRQKLPTRTFTLPAPEPLDASEPGATQVATTQTPTALPQTTQARAASAPQHSAGSIVPAGHQQPAPPTTANPRAIRVARLLQALVQEDRQPGGSELARRQRLATGLAPDGNTTTAVPATAPPSTVSPTSATDSGAPGPTGESSPGITTTPLAMELSQLIDGRESQLSPAAISPPTGQPRTPAATSPGSQLAAQPAPVPTALQPRASQAALQARLHQLTAQLQAAEQRAARSTTAAALPELPMASQASPVSQGIQQTAWDLPAGSAAVNQQATLALLMLRIEQIAARLEQLQLQNQAVPAASTPPAPTPPAPAATAPTAPAP